MKNPEQPQVERRRERRVDHSFECSFTESETVVKGKTLNVSLRGFFVQAKRTLSLGSQASFELKDSSWSKPLEIIGRVAHVRKNEGMGIEIVRISFGHDEFFSAYQTIIQKKIRLEMKKERDSSST